MCTIYNIKFSLHVTSRLGLIWWGLVFIYNVHVHTNEGSSPAGPGNFRFSGIDALTMGVATPLPVPVGVDTIGVVCLVLVGVCIATSVIALCSVLSIAFDWELFGVLWGVDSVPPCTLVLTCGVLFDKVGVLGKLPTIILLLLLDWCQFGWEVVKFAIELALPGLSLWCTVWVTFAPIFELWPSDWEEAGVHNKLLKFVLGLKEGCLKMAPVFILLMLSQLTMELDGGMQFVLSSSIDRLLFGGGVKSDWSSLVGGLFVWTFFDFKLGVFINLKDRSFSMVLVEGEKSESDWDDWLDLLVAVAVTHGDAPVISWGLLPLPGPATCTEVVPLSLSRAAVELLLELNADDAQVVVEVRGVKG